MQTNAATHERFQRRHRSHATSDIRSSRSTTTRRPCKKDDVTVLLGNALDEMRKMPDESVHLIATDPPYFIDGMGSDWNKASLALSLIHI